MKTEQIQQIVDCAPEGATHTDDGGWHYKINESLNQVWILNEWDDIGCEHNSLNCIDDMHSLSGLREILALRTELEAEKRRADELAANVAEIRYVLSHLRDGFDFEATEEDLIDEVMEETPAQSLAALKLEQQAEGVDKCISVIQKRIDSYIYEHGSPDPDTGGIELPSWGVDYVSDLEDVIHDLRNQAKEQE